MMRDSYFQNLMESCEAMRKSNEEHRISMVVERRVQIEVARRLRIAAAEREVDGWRGIEADRRVGALSWSEVWSDATGGASV